MIRSVAKGAKAVFLDRDGTINQEVHYLRSPEELRLIDGADEALVMLEKAGFKRILVTNQSGIARGYFDRTALKAIQGRLETLLARGGASLDGWYFCPHHPEAGPEGRPGPDTKRCECRKPATGMVDRAVEEHGLDPAACWVVGDSMADVLLGINAGMPAVLVLTGHGRQYAREVREMETFGSRLFVAQDLREAASIIVEQDKKGRQRG